MTQNNDDLSQIDADDALLSTIAAGRDDTSVTDDPAAALLADIVHTVDGLRPNDSPGGSGRRGRGRRGGLWGISLGVSIVVAAGGGLSAAATDHLPEPVQRFAIEVGQAAPPAEAEQVAVTPTEIWAQSDADAAADGLPYRYPQPGDAAWQNPQGESWWESGATGSGAAGGDRRSGGELGYGAPAPSGDWSSTWGYPSRSPSSGGSGSTWGGDSSSYSDPDPYSYTWPYSYQQPSAYPAPAPTGTSSPQPAGYVPPEDTATPSPYPTSSGGTSSPKPSTSPERQQSGSRNPSPSPHASPRATSSTQTGHSRNAHQAPRRGR